MNAPAANDYDAWLRDHAEQIVHRIRRQRDGGALAIDDADAIEYVVAELSLVQKSGEIIGVERLAKAMGAKSP